MGSKRLQVLLADPSSIIRRGLISMLLDLENISVDITEIEDLSNLRSVIGKINPDIVIINPIYLGFSNPKNILIPNKGIKFIALENSIIFEDILKNFDAKISINDDIPTIEDILKNINKVTLEESDPELSSREREIVRGIALGKSNKEIALELFISTHTVMTHRKNIAAKLKIHNSAGITIYAIVNKLIDINDAGF